MKARERLQAARQAFFDGSYEAALEGLVWFHHNALAEQRSLYGVRLSYALGYWEELASVYPPAETALNAVRETSVRTLLRGEGDRTLFHDVVAIDRTRKQPRATYDLYLMLRDGRPDLAMQCTDLALPAMTAAGDYRLADEVRSDPFARVRGYARQLSWEKIWMKHRYHAAPRRWAMIHSYAADVRRDAVISAGVGRQDEARRLVALAVELVRDPSLRNAIRAEIAQPSTPWPGGAAKRAASAVLDPLRQPRFCTSVRMS